MWSIFINNKELTLSTRTSVLEACRTIGIEIPRYCYHESLSIAGNCRMCVVELKNSPKPLISCATPIINGMVLYTDSPLVKKARESVMEFLLLNHPLDCPVCDQGGECDLQDQAIYFGSDKKRFYSVKRGVKDKNIGPIVKTVMTRCIHCTRCVRFAEEIAGINTLGTFNRGMSTEIGTYVSNNFSTELSGNVIDLCPVGALTAKPYPFVSRSWELKTLKNIDFSDGFCVDTKIALKNNYIVKILSPFSEKSTNSWISDKTRFSFDGMFSANRLPTSYIDKFTVKGKYAFWKTLLKEIVLTLYFVEHLYFYNMNKFKITFIYDFSISLETLGSLKILSNKFEFICLKCIEQSHENIDIESDFISLKNQEKLISNSDFVCLIGFNPRYESSKLNSLLRKRYKEGQFKVLSIGSVFNMTFPVESISLNTRSIQEILEGTHHICQQISVSKNPLFMVSSEVFKRQDSKFINRFISNIKTFSGKSTLSITPISLVNNQVGVNYLNLNKNFTHKHLKNSSALYFVDTQSSNPYVQKLVSVLSLQGIKSDFSKILMEQFFGSNYSKQSFPNKFLIPSKHFFENSDTFLNTEGLIKRSFKIVKSPKFSKTSWKIIRAFSNYFSNISLLTNIVPSTVNVPLEVYDQKSLLQLMYLPSVNYNSNSVFNSIISCSKNLSVNCYHNSYVKFFNSKLSFTVDDFYIGGKDNYSKLSSVMVKCSKQLRVDSSNFKFI